MPFGKYDKIECQNPECGKKFAPETPWQRHCCEECRNHCTYFRVTLPKRIAKYERQLEDLRLAMASNPKKNVRYEHTKERVAKWKKTVEVFMGGIKAERPTATARVGETRR